MKQKTHGFRIHMTHQTFYKLDVIVEARKKLGLPHAHKDIALDIFDREIERLKALLGDTEMPRYKPRPRPEPKVYQPVTRKMLPPDCPQVD